MKGGQRNFSADPPAHGRVAPALTSHGLVRGLAFVWQGRLSLPGTGKPEDAHARRARGWSAFDRELVSLDDAARAVRPSGLLALVDREITEAHELELTATENAQPALGIFSLALARAAMKLGVVPDFFAGHSYGELTALAAAGALDEATFVRLSFERGARMAAAARWLLARCSPFVRTKRPRADT